VLCVCVCVCVCGITGGGELLPGTGQCAAATRGLYLALSRAG